MSNIDLYVGNRKERDPHEKLVLLRILKLLDKHARDAVIFCDIVLDKRQVDILVGTETTTLQLEVKGWGWPVRAQQNGDWLVTYENGAVSRRDNAYLQALKNNQKLRNEMARYLGDGVEVSFPNGAVLFEPKIHPQSQFNMRPDPRVVMRGSDQLEDLLNTPSPSPWRLSWMREFAQEQKFIRVPVPELDDEPSSWPVKKPRQGIVTARDIWREARRRVADIPDGASSIEWVREYARARIGTTPTGPVAEVVLTEHEPVRSDRAVAISSYSRGGAPQSQSFVVRLFRLTPILCALLVAVYTLKAAFPLAHKAMPSHVAVAQRASGRHPSAKRVSENQRAKGMSPKAASMHVGDTSADIALPNSLATYRPSAPPAPITCPAGVDRLGCNGRIGTFSQPECPVGFSASGDSCIRAQGG
jgi:hypothetical protein